jgi:hypothetical protein
MKLVCSAFLNPSKFSNLKGTIVLYNCFTVYIDWDIAEYYKKQVQAGCNQKCCKFPNPEFGCFLEPLTDIDLKDQIIL